MKPTIWSEARYPRDTKLPATTPRETDGSDETKQATNAYRSEHQRDFDRLLFSAPVRRLSDKTQVWPMDLNDGVRTRLTHSHEVANLARSIGAKIHAQCEKAFSADFHNVVAPILQAISICHDLGNPPFGHQGETAIARWFAERPWIFVDLDNTRGARIPMVPDNLRDEFLQFDGNPQSIRLLTRLQTHVHDLGLDLTAATIVSALKYPFPASNYGNPDNPISKKYGYFASEYHIVEWARSATGLKEGQRHPITWIMEACDDIAYSVLDADDAMKKGVISPNDVLSILKKNDKICQKTIEIIETSFNKADALNKDRNLINDIKISYLRAALIDRLVDNASNRFITNVESINKYTHQMPLMDGDPLCDTLKKVARDYAFCHADLLRAEALGAQALTDLMTWFWDAITTRKNIDDILSRRTHPRAAYIFSLISPNYKDAAANPRPETSPQGNLVRYRELRLLTDMVSGMTDTFALNLWTRLREMT